MGKIPPYVSVKFDACAFWPPERAGKLAVQSLLELIEEYEVDFSIPEAAWEEIERAPARVWEVARRRIYICNYDMFTTSRERRELRKVQRLLFGEKSDLLQNELNDARNLLCAQKYNATYFVTFDKRHILSKRDEIKRELNFDVVTPSECLEELRRYLQR